MTTPIPPSTLDYVLGLQLTIAWAGEGLCEPPRLGWWKTDLFDAAGGGHLLERLLPRSHAWAGLEALREAARRTDEQSRQRLANPDRVVTLFHFGFEWDEHLDERLDHHKREGRNPEKALPATYAVVAESFERDALADHLRGLGEAPKVRTVPGGRQLSGDIPGSREVLASRLAAALLPWSDEYSMPFYISSTTP